MKEEDSWDIDLASKVLNTFLRDMPADEVKDVKLVFEHVAEGVHAAAQASAREGFRVPTLILGLVAYILVIGAENSNRRHLFTDFLSATGKLLDHLAREYAKDIDRDGSTTH